MDYFNPNTEPNYPPSVPNPKQQPPKPKKTKEELLGTKTSKVSGGSKFVACLMSFILGIVGTVGGVVGAGYWAVTQPISTVSDTISGIFGADFDYTEFIDESYGDKQALDLLSDTWSAI